MTIAFAVVFGIILLVGGVIVMVSSKFKFAAADCRIKNGQYSLKICTSMMYYFMFLSALFLTKNNVQKIYRKISLLSVYRNDEIQILTVWYFIISAAASGVVIIAGMILFNDIASKLLTVLLAMVLRTVLIDKQLNKTHLSVLKETVRVLSGVEQEYMK